jgi:hypothetical protein
MRAMGLSFKFCFSMASLCFYLFSPSAFAIHLPSMTIQEGYLAENGAVLLNIYSKDRTDSENWYWGNSIQGPLYQLAVRHHPVRQALAFFNKELKFNAGIFVRTPNVSYQAEKLRMIYFGLKTYQDYFQITDEDISLVTSQIKNGTIALSPLPNARITLGHFQIPNTETQIYVDRWRFAIFTTTDDPYYRVFIGTPGSMKQIPVKFRHHNSLVLDNGYNLDLNLYTCASCRAKNQGEALISYPNCEECKSKKREPYYVKDSSGLNPYGKSPLIPIWPFAKPSELGIEGTQTDDADIHSPVYVPSLKGMVLKRIQAHTEINYPDLSQQLGTLPDSLLEDLKR